MLREDLVEPERVRTAIQNPKLKKKLLKVSHTNTFARFVSSVELLEHAFGIKAPSKYQCHTNHKLQQYYKLYIEELKILL